MKLTFLGLFCFLILGLPAFIIALVGVIRLYRRERRDRINGFLHEVPQGIRTLITQMRNVSEELKNAKKESFRLNRRGNIVKE